MYGSMKNSSAHQDQKLLLLIGISRRHRNCSPQRDIVNRNKLNLATRHFRCNRELQQREDQKYLPALI